MKRIGAQVASVLDFSTRVPFRQSVARHTGLAIFGCALLLRLLMISRENLWYDEAFTAWIVRLDLSHMMRAIVGDVHPPGWYLLEWLVIRIFGDSALMMRLPSALFGAWAAWLIWRIALALELDERIAALAGFLAATVAGAVYYGQEARMYAALSAFIALMLLSALNRRFVTMAVAATAVVYLQNLGLIYVACLWAVCLFHVLRGTRFAGVESLYGRYRSEFVQLIASGLAVMSAWLFWLPSFIEQAQAVKGGFWITPFTAPGFFFPLTSMTAGWRIADGFQLHVYALIILFSAVAVYMSRWWAQTTLGQMFTALAIGMPVVTALISVLWRSIFLHRAMLPAVLLLMIPWAYAIENWPKPEKRYLWALLLPTLGITLIANYLPVQGRFAADAFVKPIREQWQAGDIVYFTTNDAAILLRYYLPDREWAIFPESSDLSQSLTDSTKAAMGFNPVAFDMLASLGYRRAWLVTENGALISKAELDCQAAILDKYPYQLITQTGEDSAYNEKIILVYLDVVNGKS